MIASGFQKQTFQTSFQDQHFHFSQDPHFHNEAHTQEQFHFPNEIYPKEQAFPTSFLEPTLNQDFL